MSESFNNLSRGRDVFPVSLATVELFEAVKSGLVTAFVDIIFTGRDIGNMIGSKAVVIFPDEVFIISLLLVDTKPLAIVLIIVVFSYSANVVGEGKLIFDVIDTFPSPEFPRKVRLGVGTVVMIINLELIGVLVEVCPVRLRGEIVPIVILRTDEALIGKEISPECCSAVRAMLSLIWVVIGSEIVIVRADEDIEGAGVDEVIVVVDAGEDIAAVDTGEDIVVVDAGVVRAMVLVLFESSSVTLIVTL